MLKDIQPRIGITDEVRRLPPGSSSYRPNSFSDYQGREAREDYHGRHYSKHEIWKGRYNP
jgi:hypothetical protein